MVVVPSRTQISTAFTSSYLSYTIMVCPNLAYWYFLALYRFYVPVLQIRVKHTKYSDLIQINGHKYFVYNRTEPNRAKNTFHDKYILTLLVLLFFATSAILFCIISNYISEFYVCM